MPMRARGGKVDGADKKGVTGIGDRTPVQHSGNKSDTQNIGRGNVITKANGGSVPVEGGKARFEALERVGKGYQPPPPKPAKATGGPVEHSAKMGPKFPGGGHGGMARLAKAHRQAGKGGIAQKNISVAAKAGQTGL